MRPLGLEAEAGEGEAAGGSPGDGGEGALRGRAAGKGGRPNGRRKITEFQNTFLWAIYVFLVCKRNTW